MAQAIDSFISYCQEIQPEDQEDIKRLFEGVICFPYDQEFLLQAYLFFNIHKVFPSCKNILLWEKAPFSDRTDFGKCDFVYLTEQNSLFLIETKFIDTTASGSTEKTKRTKHRQKVLEQVITLKHTLSDFWEISPNQFQCGIFTTDPSLVERSRHIDVLAKSISVDQLNDWQKIIRKSLRARKWV